MRERQFVDTKRPVQFAEHVYKSPQVTRRESLRTQPPRAVNLHNDESVQAAMHPHSSTHTHTRTWSVKRMHPSPVPFVSLRQQLLPNPDLAIIMQLACRSHTSSALKSHMSTIGYLQRHNNRPSMHCIAAPCNCRPWRQSMTSRIA